MTALSKFLVLLALFLSVSHANAFISLSSLTRNQVWVNHLIWLQQPMSEPTNEPSCEPISEPTNDQINDQTTNQTKQQLEQDILLPGILSSTWVLFQVSMMDDEIQACKTQSKYTQSHQVVIPVPFASFCSKSFGLAFSWVHSYWKATANLFNAQHSIQSWSSKTEVSNHQSQVNSLATTMTNQNA